MAQLKAAPVIVLLDRCLQVFTGFLVAVLLGVVTAGIIFRAFNEPLSWTDEVCGFLMVWLAGLGWMIATRRSPSPAATRADCPKPTSWWWISTATRSRPS